MSSPPRETKRLFYARQTALNMLRNRGYGVSEADIGMTLQQFVDKFGSEPERSSLTSVLTRVDDLDTRCMLAFDGSEKLAVAHIKALVQEMEEQNLRHAVLVIISKVSTFAKLAATYMEPKYTLELFREADLQVDITEHMLVPEHTLLTDEEKAEVLTRFTAKQEQLPGIVLDDPICKYYRAQRGQVFKIVRDSDHGGRSVAYRVVV